MPEEKIEKRKYGLAVAAGLLFIFAAWFASLALYLRNSLLNYQPAPNEPQEGDMVSVFLMQFLFVSAVLFSFASLYTLVVFLVRRRRNQT